MDLKPEEISKIIKAQIKQYDQKLKQDETGTIILVGDGIARASGLESCMANELAWRSTCKRTPFPLLFWAATSVCTRAASFAARGASFPFRSARS